MSTVCYGCYEPANTACTISDTVKACVNKTARCFGLSHPYVYQICADDVRGSVSSANVIYAQDSLPKSFSID